MEFDADKGITLRLTARDKYTALVLAGNIITLRDIGLLQHVKIYSASVFGCIVLAFLAQAANRIEESDRKRKWSLLTRQRNPRDRSDDYLVEYFYEPLLEFCETAHEWNALMDYYIPHVYKVFKYDSLRTLSLCKTMQTQLGVCEMRHPNVEASYTVADNLHSEGKYEDQLDNPVLLFSTQSTDVHGNICTVVFVDERKPSSAKSNGNVMNNTVHMVRCPKTDRCKNGQFDLAAIACASICTPELGGFRVTEWPRSLYSSAKTDSVALNGTSAYIRRQIQTQYADTADCIRTSSKLASILLDAFTDPRSAVNIRSQNTRPSDLHRADEKKSRDHVPHSVESDVINISPRPVQSTYSPLRAIYSAASTVRSAISTAFKAAYAIATSAVSVGGVYNRAKRAIKRRGRKKKTITSILLNGKPIRCVDPDIKDMVEPRPSSSITMCRKKRLTIYDFYDIAHAECTRMEAVDSQLAQCCTNWGFMQARRWADVKCDMLLYGLSDKYNMLCTSQKRNTVALLSRQGSRLNTRRLSVVIDSRRASVSHIGSAIENL